MGRPALNEDVNRAVAMVVNGMLPRQAWELCNKPNGENGIQNIRKRARETLLNRPAKDGSTDPRTPSQESSGASSSSSSGKRSQPPFRLNSAQVKKKRDHDASINQGQVRRGVHCGDGRVGAARQ